MLSITEAAERGPGPRSCTRPAAPCPERPPEHRAPLVRCRGVELGGICHQLCSPHPPAAKEAPPVERDAEAQCSRQDTAPRQGRTRADDKPVKTTRLAPNRVRTAAGRLRTLRYRRISSAAQLLPGLSQTMPRGTGRGSVSSCPPLQHQPRLRRRGSRAGSQAAPPGERQSARC